MEDLYKAHIRQKSMPVGFIKRGNKQKFGKLMAKIREQYSFGIDMYFITLSSFYALTRKYSGSKIKRDDYMRINVGRVLLRTIRHTYVIDTIHKTLIYREKILVVSTL